MLPGNGQFTPGGVEAGDVRTIDDAGNGATGNKTNRAIVANEREQAVIDQDHGWEAREIGGKASAIVTCELCGRPVNPATPLDDDKATFGDPENTMLLCDECRGIQARSEEPLPEPDEDPQP